MGGIFGRIFICCQPNRDPQDPGEFPDEVKALFEKAVQYYEQNLALMHEIADKAAQGRACGNLGNVHYLLGNFAKAIQFHHERLKVNLCILVLKVVKDVGMGTSNTTPRLGAHTDCLSGR